jgi:hypothetical protein
MEFLCAPTLFVQASKTIFRCAMFSYSRDEFTAPAVQRALGQTPPNDGDDSLPAVCRHLGRATLAWLLAVIAIELAVKYWGGTL